MLVYDIFNNLFYVTFTCTFSLRISQPMIFKVKFVIAFKKTFAVNIIPIYFVNNIGILQIL